MDIRTAVLERAQALADFPGQSLPDPTPELLRRADDIAGGTLFFYGERPVAVGLGCIDWTGAHLHHQEWPAQLNRFSYLGPLAAAYRDTGDDKYARAARAYIEDWITNGDTYENRDSCRPGDNTLNISIRLGSSQHSGWGGTLPAFLSSPTFDDALLETVMASMAAQAAFLADHLTAWGNWRVSQLDALVFTALRFPFLPQADHLLRVGIRGMRSALAAQFLPDGVHIERTPSYGRWMTSVLASYHRLPQHFPEGDAHVQPATIRAALDYMAQSHLFGVNDSTAPHHDPQDMSELDYRDQLLRRLFPDDEVSPPPLEQVFPHAGQVFLRSSWQPGADYLAFDASTWGGGHGHLSRLSFVFRSGGRMLVADPGILTYEMSDPFGPYGKSTPAHTTLNLNRGNQSGADPVLLRTDFTPRTALIHARYDGGYWPGEYGWSFRNGRGDGTYGVHERLLFWLRGEYLLALDTMEADPASQVYNIWQLGPLSGCESDAESLAWRSQQPDAGLSLQMILAPEGATMYCWEGSRDPIRGWVGRRGDDAVPAPLVEFSYPIGPSGSAVSAVLLVPLPGRVASAYRAGATGRHLGGHLHHVGLSAPDGAADYVAWSRKLESPIEEGLPFTTDATFAWLRIDPAGRAVEGFLLDGSYLEHNGASLLDDRERRPRLLTFRQT